MSHLSQEKAFALSVAREAFRICRNAPRQVRKKIDGTPVTAGDLAIQATVARMLKQNFEEDALIGEEDISNSTQDTSLWREVNELAGFDALPILKESRHPPPCKTLRFWCLDPIDGTKGFLTGGSYAIGLALMRHDNHNSTNTSSPILSTLALPAEGVILQGMNEVNTLETHNEDVVNPRKTKNIEDKYPIWMLSGESDLTLKGLPPWTSLCCGSLVKYASVAQGQAIAFVQSLKGKRALMWDHAAGVTAVIASGGNVTDEWGRSIRFGNGVTSCDIQIPQGTNAIVATAEGINHTKFCELVSGAIC